MHLLSAMSLVQITCSRAPLTLVMSHKGPNIYFCLFHFNAILHISDMSEKMPLLTSFVISNWNYVRTDKLYYRSVISLSLSYVYPKQPIFWLTQEWFRELSFSRLECGVHDKLHISSADWWDLFLPLA